MGSRLETAVRRNHEVNMQPIFLSKINIFWAVRSVFSGFFRNLIRLTRKARSRRFLLLSPPCLCMQVIYDRKKKDIFYVYIRDRTDLGTLRQIFQDEDYGFSKLRRYRELEEKYASFERENIIPIIIDCGANIGLAARYFSREYPNAVVICVEPDMANLALARRNNRSRSIRYYLGAIGSAPGRARIINKDDSPNAYRTEYSSNGDLAVYSIAQLTAQESSEKNICSFVAKIDIEGFESELFSKNTDWVMDFDVLIVELHDWMLPGSASSSSFLETISRTKRDFVYIGENMFSIRNSVRSKSAL